MVGPPDLQSLMNQFPLHFSASLSIFILLVLFLRRTLIHSGLGEGGSTVNPKNIFLSPRPRQQPLLPLPKLLPDTNRASNGPTSHPGLWQQVPWTERLPAERMHCPVVLNGGVQGQGGSSVALKNLVCISFLASKGFVHNL